MNEIRYREAERRLWASLAVDPTERRLHLDRTGATVRIQEIGDGPAVVFVHGGSICGTSWAPLVAQLDGFRCVLLDRPGCGLSPPLAAGLRDVDRFASFSDALIVDVLDALGLERAAVGATSFGGYTALRSAAAHPDRIERVMEFGFPIGAPLAKVPFVMRMATVPMLGILAASIPPTRGSVRMILRQIGLGQALAAGRISPVMIDWFLSMLRDTDTMVNEIKSIPRFITPLRGMNERLLFPTSLLESIRVPVHFLWGTEDPFGGEAIARAFVSHIPHATLELVPGAGHAVWMDDAESVAAKTRVFLDR